MADEYIDLRSGLPEIEEGVFVSLHPMVHASGARAVKLAIRNPDGSSSAVMMAPDKAREFAEMIMRTATRAENLEP